MVFVSFAHRDCESAFKVEVNDYVRCITYPFKRGPKMINWSESKFRIILNTLLVKKIFIIERADIRRDYGILRIS